MRSLNLVRASLDGVRSRVLIGAGAWLLGAVAATAGSLFAVEQLGQGILAQPSTQLTVSKVNAELAIENAERPAPSPSASASPGRAAKPAAHRQRPAPSAGAAQLLVSPDGTAVAVCQARGAYLVNWSPYNGYEADHVVRGPQSVASVTFRGSNGGIVMRVSCQAGSPVAHLSPFQSGDDGGGHDN